MPSSRPIVITRFLFPDPTIVTGINRLPFTISINRRGTGRFVDFFPMRHATGIVESEGSKSQGREGYLNLFHRFDLLAYNQIRRATSCNGGFPRPKLSAFDRREVIKRTARPVTLADRHRFTKPMKKAATGHRPSPLGLLSLILNAFAQWKSG